MVGMSAKKPKKSGKHATPRRGVQFPIDWLAYAKRVAAREKRPVVWLLIELLKERGDKLGVPEPPPPPWGEDDNPSKE